jgi:hypothetical protein
MQCLIGIKESSRGCPKARQEAEQGDRSRGYIAIALKPAISVFRQRSLSSRIISSKDDVLSTAVFASAKQFIAP